MLAEIIRNILLSTLVCAVIMFVLIRRRRKPSTFPPGPLSIPVLGNLHQLGTEPHKTFMKMSEKYGRIFAIDFGSFRGVVLNDYKLIKQCFSERSFSGRPDLRLFRDRSGGVARGLICSSDETWAEQRAFVMKSLKDFGYGKRQIMEALIQEEINELIENLKDEVGKPFSTSIKFNGAVLNSLWKICAGDRYDLNDATLMKILFSVTTSIKDSKATGAGLFFPTLTKLAPNMTGYNRLLSTSVPVVELIKHKLAEHKETYEGANNRDLIDAFWQKILSTSDPHSSFFQAEGELNMMYSLLDLFLAGSETTSTTISWTCLLLALNPEVQDKLYEEIREKIGTSRLPGLNDRNSMPYTESVILEVLRFAALVPLGVFHNTTEDVMIDGYLIPKDTMVVANLYAALHDPVWGDPHNFRPNRFLLPDGTVDRHHAAHLVFSVGKRACLGESLARDELFLFITSIFQRFHVTYNPKLPRPTTEPHCSPVLAPKYHELILYERP